MRISGVNTERGSVTVFIMLSMTLIVTMLALLIDAGRITVARARLEVAADRAAYAGAAALSHALNSVAKENWKIHKAWRDLKHDYDRDMQQTVESATQRFHRYEGERDAAFDSIALIQNSISRHAREIAIDVLSANAPFATGNVLASEAIPLRDDIDPGEQQGRPRYDRVTGQSFIDPVGTESATFDALKFLIKPNGPNAAIGVSATQKIKPMLLSRFIDGDIEINATAAASSFGGSIERFARKETGSFGEAAAQISEDGSDGLYHQAMVPMWTLGEAGEGAVH